MLNKNKNRGAGLVTVVVVLAVSSVLLSASIWLSFSHYKNVMTAETTDEERAELDLCAELFCMSLNSNLASLQNFTSSGAMYDFYALDSSISYDESSRQVSVFLSDGHLLISPTEMDNDVITVTIGYYRGEELLLESEYTMKKNDNDGKYQIVQLEEVDTEAEEEMT